MWLLCLLPISVILFAAILASLQRSAMFGKNTTIAVALCATLLCMFGLYETFVRPGNAGETDASREGTGFDFVLIPYVTLALAILAVLLLLFVQKVPGRRDAKHPCQETLWPKEGSYGGKERGDKSRPSQDLRRLRQSSELAKLRHSNLSDSFQKRLRNPSTSKETSK